MIFRSPHPDVEIPDLSLSDYLFEHFAEHAGKAAMIEADTGRTVTYGELKTRSQAVALGLSERGIEPGDVVAICSPNLPEYAIAFHGIAMAGACSTTLNPLQTVDELVHQISDSGARFFITIPPLVEKAGAVAEETGIEEVFVFGEAEGATPFADLIETGMRARQAASAGGGHDPFESLSDRVGDTSETLVTLPYSSGTTGKPKGVMLTHRNLVANLQQYLVADPVGEDEVVVAVLPFFHIYGMVVVMSACLRAGATLVTQPRFELEKFLGLIQEHGVTRAYVVPPIILALAKHPVVDDYDLSSLDLVTSGAAPLGEEIALGCQSRLGVKVSQGYGLTEASPVTHLRPLTDEGSERIATVGPTLSNTEVCVVDLDSGERLGVGDEGEVWIRGPQIMKGYLNNPEATAITVDDAGWLHTGDVGRVDDDGFLTIVDRAKELIKYKGYQVPPAELEDVLLAHPAVNDAAVIPSPDEESGEVPKAFVVCSEPVEAADIMAFVAERVSPYKKVRLVEFTDEIPKSPSGKILRRVLVKKEREAVGEGSPGPASADEPARQTNESLQDTYASNSICFGCGPANPEGLRIKSFAEGDEVVAEWTPGPNHQAFPGVLNGGIIGTLLDCHCNWAAVHAVMLERGLDEPAVTVTGRYEIKLRRPTPTDQPVRLVARATEIDGDRITVEGELQSGEDVTARCEGLFVVVGEGHPAHEAW